MEKIGPKRYRITDGGFTTCLQPTPRWEITSTTVTVNLDDYAILRNSVLKVKGVPVFYMPVFYYPIQNDDRATGFLIPTYGNSTYRGQSLSNAFFWAVNRSQDVTLLHDWFTQTGQGMGAEYRYVAAPGSEGAVRTYFLKERETLTVGDTAPIPGRRSYELKATVSQSLPKRFRARANIDYFSDVTTQQLYHQNIYDASQRWRSYSGGVSGSLGFFSLNAQADVREVFYGESSSTIYGGAPRLAFNMAPKRLGRSPVYVSFGTDYTRQVREDRSTRVTEQGLTRFDWTPLVRVPLTKWPFLTVQSSLAWHNTYYTESLELPARVQVNEPIFRQYLDFQTEVVGPTFVKIWDTPRNGYAEKFKHVIEPSLVLQRTTAIDEFDRIVQLETTDYVVGNTTRLQYGITNRFLARRQERGRPTAREFLTIALTQSYYTDPLASQYDRVYASSFNAFLRQSNFSPIALSARASLTDLLEGTARVEYDPILGGIQRVSANGTLGGVERWVSRIGWSRSRILGSDLSDNFINGDANIRSAGNRIGGTYSLNYNIARREFLQQRFTAYYNAQCCGVAVEYQAFNFGTYSSRFVIPQDRRFNMSFTLAGVGTFSNFFGAFGGAPARY
jgi:LPS-assembly protein